MSIIEETRFLERQQFFHGQRLFASDLQAIEEFNREMRWLHNLSMHGQPGVGLGFIATGDEGARQVTVDPGYAVDHLGREIVLTQSRTLTLPPTAGEANGDPVFYDLTVAYPDERDLEESETRAGICLPRGTVRLREEPIFCWIRLSPTPSFQPLDPRHKQDIELGRLIHLARAEVLNCKLNKPLSLAQRRSAQPSALPYVACGSTPTGSWEVEISERFGVRIHRDVETAAAGFRTGPCYCAQIAGSRVFMVNNEQFVIDGLTSISETSVGGFHISMLIPLAFLAAWMPSLLAIRSEEGAEREQLRGRIDNLINESDWHVEWIGTEG